MYETLLLIHSWTRWLVLAAGIVAIGIGLRGWLGRLTFTGGARAALRAFVVALDLQLVVGLILYVWVSPITRLALSNMGAAMRDAQLRFWAVEHAPMMLIATVLAHVGNVRVRRAGDDRGRYKAMAIFLTIALVLILATIPWPGMKAGRPLFR
jgi:hypothetical protein